MQARWTSLWTDRARVPRPREPVEERTRGTGQERAERAARAFLEACVDGVRVTGVGVRHRDGEWVLHVYVAVEGEGDVPDSFDGFPVRREAGGPFMPPFVTGV